MSQAEHNVDDPLAIVEAHDAMEDRPTDLPYDLQDDLVRRYPELRTQETLFENRYWSMLLENRVGVFDRDDRHRFLGDPDVAVAGRRRIDDKRRRKARTANKASRAARRAGRR